MRMSNLSVRRAMMRAYGDTAPASATTPSTPSSVGGFLDMVDRPEATIARAGLRIVLGGWVSTQRHLPTWVRVLGGLVVADGALEMASNVNYMGSSS